MAKLQKTPNYDPFVSGELATSTRFIFEQMQQGGINTLASDQVKTSGLPPYNPSNFQSEFDTLTKAGVSLSAGQMQALLANKVTSGEAASAMMVRFNSTYGYEAFNVGLYNLMKRRSADPLVKITSPVKPLAILKATQSGDIEPALYTSSESLLVHPSLLSTANDAATNPVASSRLEAMAVSPDCGGPMPPNSDGNGGDDGYSGDGGETPGELGDPDTSEDQYGDIVYENVLYISQVNTCRAIDGLIALGASLSYQFLKNADPKTYAALAASLSLSPEVLLAFIAGIGAIAAYQAIFCSSTSSS